MSITDVILRVSAKRMRDFETVGQYCAEYDGAFNQIKGMLVDGAKYDPVHPVNSERLQRYTTEHLRRELQASFKRFIQTWPDPSNRRDFSRKSTSSPSPVTPADTHMCIPASRRASGSIICQHIIAWLRTRQERANQ